MDWRPLEFGDIPSREEFEHLTMNLLRQGIDNSDTMRDEIRRHRKLILQKATGNWNRTPSDKFVNEHAWVLEDLPGFGPAAARHNISNIVIKVDGNKAVGRSYWFHYSNDNPQRRGVFDGFGHYEDELVKRSMGNGCSQSGRSTAKGVMSGRIRGQESRLVAW
jgi:hypothetical protein